MDQTVDYRAVFVRSLALPRGPDRERVWARTRTYDLRGSEARTLSTVGAFRVVPAAHLREADDTRNRLSHDLRHLRDLGLVRTLPYVVGRERTTLVTLTPRGRDLLEECRLSDHGRRPQVFYDGIVKPRELAHDSRLYQAYLHAAERLQGTSARVRRVVLDAELKRDYQQFLQAHNRGRRDSSGRSDRTAEEIARWAHEHQLPIVDEHVAFPDVRIEYEDRDGRDRVEDVEVTTPHYRGAHAAGRASTGFSCYRAFGAHVGGMRTGRSGGSADPHLAEEMWR